MIRRVFCFVILTVNWFIEFFCFIAFIETSVGESTSINSITSTKHNTFMQHWKSIATSCCRRRTILSRSKVSGFIKWILSNRQTFHPCSRCWWPVQSKIISFLFKLFLIIVPITITIHINVFLLRCLWN